MGNSDIILDQNWTRVIENLSISTDEGADPDIRMLPKWATLHLGGGDGSNSDGDLKFHDKSGRDQIHFSATDTDSFESNISAQGEYGWLKLGGGDTSGMLLLSNNVDDRQVEIDSGYSGSIKLWDNDGNVGTEIYSTSIQSEDVFCDEVTAYEDLTAPNGRIKDLQLGGGNPSENVYEPGTLKLWDDEGNDSVTIDGKEGSIQFKSTPVEGADHATPMMYMFADGYQNSDQPVISHSPAYPKWGLQYYDDKDIMSFEGNDSVLSIDLYGSVGVGVKEPKADLHVDGDIRHTGTVSTLSDARAKQNVEPIHGALETVQQLEGVNYEWDDEAVSDLDLDDDSHVGFLAQEVEEVLPEAVTEDGDGLLGTADGSFTPILVEAIKEQQELIDEQADTIDRQDETIEDQRAELDAQEERIEDQQEQIETLEERLASLEAAIADQ